MAVPWVCLERADGEQHRLIRIHRSEYLGDLADPPQRFRGTDAIALLDVAPPPAEQRERDVARALRPAFDTLTKLATRGTVVSRRQRVDGLGPRIGAEACANESQSRFSLGSPWLAPLGGRVSDPSSLRIRKQVKSVEDERAIEQRWRERTVTRHRSLNGVERFEQREKLLVALGERDVASGEVIEEPGIGRREATRPLQGFDRPINASWIALQASKRQEPVRVQRARSGVRLEPAPRSTDGDVNVFETSEACRGGLAASLAGNECRSVARVARVPVGFAGQGGGHEAVADECALELLGARCIVARGATREE